MKTHLIIVASILIPCLSPAQELIPKSEPQKIAERIDERQTELIRHVESELKSFHAAVNTPGQQQAILDIFGTNAVAALQKYVAMRSLIAQLNPATTVPDADLDVFVPNQDGSVTYVAPPEPEPEAE